MMSTGDAGVLPGFSGVFDPHGDAGGPAQSAADRVGLRWGSLEASWSLHVDAARSERGVALFWGEPCPRASSPAADLLRQTLDDPHAPPPEGHFAALIYAHQTRTLTLFRDRGGVYRLYHRHLSDGRLAFSTSLRTLARLEPRPRLDISAARTYLLIGYSPGPRTLLEGVCKLLPGFALEASRAQTRVRPYWQPRFDPVENGDLKEQTRRYRTLFREAVDWSIGRDSSSCGITLSGGIDSSAIALTARQMGLPRLHTFSYRIEGAPAGHDETAKAARMAAELGTSHHEVSISARAYLDALPDMLREGALEETVEPGLGPFYFMHREAARQGCTVLLNGAGSESNGGRECVREAHLKALLLRLLPPRVLRRLNGRWLKYLPASVQYSFRKLIKQGDPLYLHLTTVMGALADEPELLSSWSPGAVKPEPEDGLMRVDVLLDEAKDFSPFNRTLYVRQRTWNSEHFLYVPHAVGLTTCRASSPFMYPPLVAFMSRVPVSSKLTWRSADCRKLLYRAFAGELPASILRQPKVSGAFARWDWCRRVCHDTLKRQSELELLERYPELLSSRARITTGPLSGRLAFLAQWHAAYIEAAL